MKFIIIQILGIIAWCIESISYWAEKKRNIIFLQIIADLFFAIHYYLLGAKTGAIVCTVSLIREYIFFMTKEQKNEYIWCCVMIFAYVVLGIITSLSVIDLLPICAEIIYCYTLICDADDIVIGGIIDSTYWLIYGIICHSYAGIISDAVVILSNIIILLKRYTKTKIHTLISYSNE